VTGSNTFSGGTANLTGNYICTNGIVTISGGEAKFSAPARFHPPREFEQRRLERYGRRDGKHGHELDGRFDE